MARSIKLLVQRVNERLRGRQRALGAIFDPAYYLRCNPGVAAAGLDPWAHFASLGWAEGRNPCALFETSYYFVHNSDVAQAGLNPLIHYVTRGWREGRRFSPLFDADWYLANNPDVAAAVVNPLLHYVLHGATEGREANALFDSAWYAARYPEAVRAARSPLAHYAEFGTAERLSPHPLFDGAFYLETYADVAKAGLNPLAHFLEHGLDERRQPHPSFCADRVLDLLGREEARDGGRAASGQSTEAYLGDFGNYRLCPSDLAAPPPALVEAKEYDRQTREIVSRYGLVSRSREPLALSRFQLASDYAQGLREAWRSPAAHADSILPSFSVVTAFFRHRRFFAACAASVAALTQHTNKSNPDIAIEWIVVNDDPSISNEALLHDAQVHPGVCSVLGDKTNRGIVHALNHGIGAANHAWVLILDCDDLIEPNAIEVLQHYIRRFPSVRYISSAMIDIDEQGTILRYRRRDPHPERMLQSGMHAGHLMAVRRDAIDEIGLFDPRFAGCQDYDFALRVLEHEPVLRIPEYLYRYRYHSRSQSVGRFSQQEAVSDRVRRSAALRHVRAQTKDAPRGFKPLTSNLGVALVRTQGNRMTLLCEAIESSLMQSPSLEPCIIVHNEEEVRSIVESRIRQEFSAHRFPILSAPDLTLKRGYPLNVGLDYASKLGDHYGYVALLDDDDLLYPNFSSSLTAVLSNAGADIAYGASLRREPNGETRTGYEVLPFSAILAANFITTNSYIVRLSFLRGHGIRFPEHMHYLEDYHFLLQILGHGAAAGCVFEPVSEFTVTGDGNTPQRRFPREFAACNAEVSKMASAIADSLEISTYWEELLRFSFERRSPLTSKEDANLVRVESMLARTNGHA